MEMEKEESQPSRGKKGPITIELIEPVEWGSETIKQVTLQPIKGKHLRKMPAQPDMNFLMQTAAKISGISGGVFDDMCAEDVMRVADAVGDLL